MKKMELDVYSEESNYAIVRAAGRRFPGVLIQGDSLAILCSEAREISAYLQRAGVDDQDILGVAQEHQAKLLDRLLHYQSVLLQQGIGSSSGLASQGELIALIEGSDDPSSDKS
jgi:hypothetical protein